jgi:hypothetical protein
VLATQPPGTEQGPLRRYRTLIMTPIWQHPVFSGDLSPLGWWRPRRDPEPGSGFGTGHVIQVPPDRLEQKLPSLDLARGFFVIGTEEHAEALL